jgi:hypothetical protein
MALIACPECARQISDKAPVCPGCGVPLSAATGSRWTFGKVAGTWIAASALEGVIVSSVFIVAAAAVGITAIIVFGK